MSRWRALTPEQRQAALAATALALSLVLPWYQTSSPAVVAGRAATIENSLSAFEAFSFVEAAILLVAAGVLYLLWARSEQRAFHLPGGDGWVTSAAGAWAIFLLVWRLFDKPDIERAAVGVDWGIFGAMAAAAALIAAGQRVRAAHTPEPPNPAEEPTPRRRRRGDRGERVPVDPAAVTQVLAEAPPAWEGEPPPPPSRAKPVEIPPLEPEPAPPEPKGPPDRLF